MEPRTGACSKPRDETGPGTSGTPRFRAVPVALPGISSEAACRGGPSRDLELPANPGVRAQTGENGDAVPSTQAPRPNKRDRKLKSRRRVHK
ncbi:hypothetical protein NDU88_002594 [Pleurodeles waltl]|uniref:Uncharacterized protein n=1 Tax=Pleurodeles waltl TaxID=8319 RepID=A0AAV7T396_PLEWA|nr:hypothetical protein NDU88_002594 [Pleurodeles waltl]